jgi:soluble lytic murein transglycosylase-like protein
MRKLISMPPKSSFVRAKFLLGALLAFRVCAAEAPAANDPRAAMQSSLEKQQAAFQKQRESVRQQIGLSKQLAERAGDFISAFPPLAPAVMARLQPDCPAMAPEQVDALVKSAAEKQSIEPNLIRAVIKQESGFRPCVVSAVGAQGLMQLMPDTADQLQVADAFDPEQNVNGGAAYLKQLLTKYKGDLKLTLGAYNAGPKRTDDAGGVPNIPETQNYVASILADMGAEASKKKDRQPGVQN